MDARTDLPCLPESRLPAHVAAQLPAATPPPPWHCRVRAVVWVQRAPAPVPGGRGVSLGALVEYLESPVGPYREVFAGPLLRGHLLPVVRIPFMAVDSLPSVHGGRAHWALPKTTATFTETTARGDGWSVEVDARPAGPRLPLRGLLRSAQTERVAGVSLRGTGRLARVHVAAHGPALTGWLGTGTHVGVVGEGRMVVRAPG